MNDEADAPSRIVRLADCFSVRRPESFAVDWAGFYRRSLARRGTLLASTRHQVDVRYGPDPFQLLNVVSPADADGSAPVLLFLHGGAFREGHPAFYDMLAAPWARRGVVFVSVGYRLAPACPYPDSTPDLRLALRWAWRHISRHGGDPTRMVVSGHSAGAVLAATAAFRDDWQRQHGLPADVVRGAILVSGLYDFRAETFGLVPDPARVVEASPICHLQRTPPRTLVAFGTPERNRVGGDPEMFARSASPFVAAVRAAGGQVETLALAGHDHVATATALSEPGHALHEAAGAMMDQVTPAAG